MPRRVAPTLSPAAPTLAPERGVALLRDQIAKASEMLRGPVEPNLLAKWTQTSEALVREAVGGVAVERFSEAARPRLLAAFYADDDDLAQEKVERLRRMVTVLESCIEQLSLGLGPRAVEPEPGRFNADRLAELGVRTAFLADDGLRTIVSRDLRELMAARRAESWKTCLLLCGSIAEAALIDVLDRRRDLASPFLKRRRFPDEASLADLIAMAADVTLVGHGRYLLSATVAGVAVAVTDHRDLIHPQAELRARVQVDRDTADTMIHVLALILRDLTEAEARGDIAAYMSK